MRKLRPTSLLLAFFILAFACDDDPSFTSLEGEWEYVTPDNKVSFTFELELLPSSTEHKFKNVKINVGGLEYTPTGSDDPLAICNIFHGPNYPSAFSSFSFYRYSTTYDYQINLSPITPNKEFSQMTAATMTYMYFKDGFNFGNGFMENTIIRRK